MKKFSLGILVTFLFAFLFEIAGFWQAMVVAGFVGSWFAVRSAQAFGIGFCGVAFCWLAMLAYAEIRHHIFPIMKLTGQIFMLPENASFLLLIVTPFIGGVLGGLGGLNGLWWRRAILKK